MINKLVHCALMIALVFCGSNAFAQNRAQRAIDEKLLNDYFAKNKIVPQRTPSGVYYTISTKGSGDNCKFGQRVTMSYIGKFLNGEKFDANVDDNFNPIRPFSFVLGTGQVIKGWDDGVKMLKKGSHAMLYLPSDVAYGPSGMGPIPPNAVLMFEVEVTDVKNN